MHGGGQQPGPPVAPDGGGGGAAMQNDAKPKIIMISVKSLVFICVKY